MVSGRVGCGCRLLWYLGVAKRIILLDRKNRQDYFKVKIEYTGCMRIIGIDPGTGILGFGVIDADKDKFQLVDAGVIKTPPHTPLNDRLNEIFDGLNQIINETKPDVMSIEKLFFAQNTTTAMSVSHARGVAMLVGQRNNLKIAEYTPLQIKQTITGYGKADKKQVQEMVRIRLRLKKVPKPDDMADALAAAITHSLMTRV